MFVCPQHNFTTNKPRMFKLGGGVDLEDTQAWYALEVKRSKVKVTGSMSAFFAIMAITSILVMTEHQNFNTR